MEGGERGWRFGAVLVTAMTSTVFVVPTISVLAPELTRDLAVTAGGIGGLLSLLYAVSAAGSPFMGGVLDRLGSRRAAVVMYALVLAGTVGFAAARSYAGLLAAVVVLGLALTIANPLTNHLVAERAAPASRGVYVGWKQAGGQLAWFVAGVALPGAVTVWGWRAAALSGVVLAAVGLLATITTVGERDRRSASGDEAGALSVGAVHHASILVLCAYSFLMSAGVSAFNTFLPMYLEVELDLGASRAGTVVAVMGLASVAGRVAWTRQALGSSRLVGRLALLSGAAVTATLLMAAASRLWVAAAWVAALVMGTMATAWSAMVSLIIVQQFGAGATGRASGVVMTTIHLGLLATPAVVGAAIDRSGGYGPVWLAATALFGLAAAVALAARGGTKTLTRDSCLGSAADVVSSAPATLP